MKLNHLICPNCGHDFLTDAAYGTCDACQTFFYAARSRTCHPPVTAPSPAIVTISTTGREVGGYWLDGIWYPQSSG